MSKSESESENEHKEEAEDIEDIYDDEDDDVMLENDDVDTEEDEILESFTEEEDWYWYIMMMIIITYNNTFLEFVIYPSIYGIVGYNCLQCSIPFSRRMNLPPFTSRYPSSSWIFLRSLIKWGFLSNPLISNPPSSTGLFKIVNIKYEFSLALVCF